MLAPKITLNHLAIETILPFKKAIWTQVTTNKTASEILEVNYKHVAAETKAR